MKKRFAGCILIPMLIGTMVIIIGFIYIQHADDHNAIEATKEWARLKDFPATAKNLSVEVTGNMFTRGFTIQFDAPLADIERWLNDSPGTKDVTPNITGDNRHYDIEPGGGAVHAELDLDEKTGQVRIRTYWS